MEVTYDSEVDILSIVLDVRKTKQSTEILPGVVVDLDHEDSIIAFEILDARKITDLSQVKVAVSRPSEFVQP